MKSSIKNLLGILASSVLVLTLVFLTQYVERPNSVLGSVSQGSEYFATSTRNFDGTSLANLSILRNGYGVLGSYVITGANTGTINLYDATTSNVSKRTGNAATSTILIASFPASATAQTYVLDSVFTRGLLYEIVGTAATGPITTR